MNTTQYFTFGIRVLVVQISSTNAPDLKRAGLLVLVSHYCSARVLRRGMPVDAKCLGNGVGFPALGGSSARGSNCANILGFGV